MRFILLRFWFIFLPLIAYVLYVQWRRGNAIRKGLPPPRLFDGPWRMAVIATLLLGIGGFVFLGMTEPASTERAPQIQLAPDRAS